MIKVILKLSASYVKVEIYVKTKRRAGVLCKIVNEFSYVRQNKVTKKSAREWIESLAKLLVDSK